MVLNCLIISEDYIFRQIFHRLLRQRIPEIMFIPVKSFIQLNKMQGKMDAEIVILDDSISGAAHHEVISHLRLEMKIYSPIYYFSQADYIEKVAYANGISFFYKKPFDPDEVIDHMIDVIGKKQKLQRESYLHGQ